jgi:sn-glycerol 3-phosphate transport system permease protein
VYRTFLFGQNLTFVGFENFLELFTSVQYQRSLSLTFAFSGVVVVGTMVVSLLVAFLIYRLTHAKAAYLVAAIWPYAVPPAVGAMVFLFLTNPSTGVYTHYLEQWVGVEIAWYTNGVQAFTIISIVAIWKQIGFNVIFMLAALNKIPKALTEVARLDGVSWIRMLGRVYLPLIKPTLVFLVVMNTIYAFFETFAFIDLMTQGGPKGMTNFLIYKLFRDAFDFNKLGLASAESIILFVLVAGLTYIQLRLSDKRAQFT